MSACGFVDGTPVYEISRLYAHVRRPLQRDAIDALGHALGSQDDPDDPPAAAVVR